MLTNEDTIAAIATPVGVGGVGIIRISGAKAPDILSALFKPYQAGAGWQSHRLYVGQVIEPQSGLLLDEALAVLMRAPHSYTKEQVAELHCHGGPAVLSQVLTACLAAGARLAQRGEFTARAFLNGALSLDEAEAVADLVSAKTAKAAQMAARQLQGALSSRVALLEQEVLTILASVTVGVDFPEDADAPGAGELLPSLAALRQKIANLLAGAEAGRIYREGLATVLAGASNVGKSSLLNRLLQTERAIVTPEAGTTRDVIEEALNVEGLPLLLFDTAGLRETAALTEAETQGIERSRAALAAAELVLIVTDGRQGLDATARKLLNDSTPQNYLLLLNKADLLNRQETEACLTEYEEYCPAQDIAVISAKSGAGIEDLLIKIKHKALAGLTEAGREPLLNNIRHQQALLRADRALADAEAALMSGFPPDMAAIDMENACAALGEISGKTVSEEVLANIFANFCLGK